MSIFFEVNIVIRFIICHHLISDDTQGCRGGYDCYCVRSYLYQRAILYTLLTYLLTYFTTATLMSPTSVIGAPLNGFNSTQTELLWL